MQYKSQTIGVRGALVLENHPAIGILGALVRILATYESKSHRPWIVFCWRRDRATGAASIAVRIAETIPIDMCGFQAADEHTARPIRCFRDRRFRGCDNPGEAFVFRDFYNQLACGIALWWPARP